MTNPILPGDIDRPDKIEATKHIGDDQKEFSSTGQSFSSFMQKEPSSSSQTPSVKQVATSPFDLAASSAGLPPGSTPTMDSIHHQIQTMEGSFTSAKEKLSYPDLKLRQSEKQLLKDKLGNVNTSLQSVGAKLGIPPITPTPVSAESLATKGPIAQYIGYLEDGNNQLYSIKNSLAAIQAKGETLNPADFLLVQLKVNRAQQEIDFTSALLGKAIEATKSLMNINL